MPSNWWQWGLFLYFAIGSGGGLLVLVVMLIDLHCHWKKVRKNGR